jgi:O-antigen/teichoic acid export membrane protein
VSLFRRTASDTLWNIVGQVAPGLVALVAVPLLVRGLGTERFGVLGLAWAVIGYLSLFDLGLGRAVTRFAAEALAEGDQERFASVVATGWVVLTATGIVVAGLAQLATIGVSARLLHFSDAGMAREGRAAFLVLAAGLPAVVLTAGMRGVLEASGHFREANLVRIPLGILAFAGPVFLLPFTHHLAWHIGAVALTRLLGVVVYGIACVRVHPILARRPRVDREVLRRMLSFGMWITVSSVVSPLMATMDRFIVGAVLSVTAVTYYVVPFELASRVLILPAAISTVAFTRFAANRGNATAESRDLYRGSTFVIAALLLPLIVGGILFANEILTVWISPTMGRNGASTLRWLLAGLLFNALAHIPFAQLQGQGAADITAKAHLFELPIYAVLMLVLLRRYGVEGAAMAWSARVALDYAILYIAAKRRGAPATYRNTAGALAAVLLALAASAWASLPVRGAVFVVMAIGAGTALWSVGGREQLRATVSGRLRTGGRA